MDEAECTVPVSPTTFITGAAVMFAGPGPQETPVGENGVLSSALHSPHARSKTMHCQVRSCHKARNRILYLQNVG